MICPDCGQGLPDGLFERCPMCGCLLKGSVVIDTASLEDYYEDEEGEDDGEEYFEDSDFWER